MESKWVNYSPILLKKSYEIQKVDLLKILDCDKPLICSQVYEQWRSNLDLVIERVFWNASWNISRDYCFKFDIPYPTTAIVEVQTVDFNSFHANVKVITVEDDIIIPEFISDVPLRQLRPTHEQTYNVIDINEMASWLHDFRFFFAYLWYPWDEFFFVNEDWFSSHFEDRLLLYYDIISRQMVPKIRLKIEGLIEEAKEIYERIKELEEQMIDADTVSFYSESNSVITDKRHLLLSRLRLKLSCIVEQLNFYEKKSTRNLLVDEPEMRGPTDIVSLAWPSSGTPDKFASLVNELTNHLSITCDSSICFQASDCLDELLSPWKLKCRSGKLFLSEGVYTLSKSSWIDVEDGVLQGLDDRDNVIINDSEEYHYLLEIKSKCLKITSLCLETGKVKHILVVRAAKCCLKDVKITNCDQTEIAIHVSTGGLLIADGCHFSNFSTAISASEGSSVILTKCVFENNGIGIEYHKGCSLSVDSCQFINNNSFAILMDTSGSSVKTGNDILKNVPGVKIINTTFNGNKNDFAKYC